MSISRKAYENINREYDSLRMKAAQDLEVRRFEIESKIPELSQIEIQITALYVEQAAARINGNLDQAVSYKNQIFILNQKKISLLKNAGYTLDDLKPHYVCPICEDTGYKDGIPCNCFKEKIINQLYDMSHIRGILDRENFKTFSFKYYANDGSVTKDGKSPLVMAKSASAKALAFVKNFSHSHDNLLICGDTGVGKTFLTNCITKELLDQGFSVIYLSSIRFFEILADATFRNNDDNDDLPAKLIYECDLLIIDDLGTEMVNSFVQTHLFDCINERYLREKHTIISTNYSVEQLLNVYSERVFSRITSNYTVIKLIGDDIRIKKALEE